MKMTGEYRIPASRDLVWVALNDAETLKQCLRGCQHLERVDDSHMIGTLTTKVGPIRATFNGKITLSQIDPPNGYYISGEGKAGPAGLAKGGAKVALHEDNGGTVLTYVVEASLGGKLAQLGSRVIDAVAKRLADDFFQKFAGEVAQEGDDPAATDGCATGSGILPPN